MLDSDHSLDEFVDELLSVAPSTTVLVGVSLGSESLLGGVELEGPEEVVGFLEVSTDGGDLVDEVLNRGETVLAELALNDGVVSERNARSIDLSVAALVDELADNALAGVAVGNVGLDSSDHVHGGLVKSNEHTVVELSQSQELKNLSAGGVQLVDTKLIVEVSLITII